MVGDSEVTAQRYFAIASDSESAVCILYIVMPLLTSFDSDLIPFPKLWHFQRNKKFNGLGALLPYCTVCHWSVLDFTTTQHDLGGLPGKDYCKYLDE